MMICTVLVMTLGQLVRANLVDSTINNLTKAFLAAQTEVANGSVGFCYFQDFPSISCVFNCFWKGESPSCKGQMLCFCTKEEDIQMEGQLLDLLYLPTPAAHVDEERSEQVFLFFNKLSSLLGFNNDTVTQTGSGITYINSEVLWTVFHAMVIIILLMLIAMVILEVLDCCRNHSRNRVSIRSVLYPAECDKSSLY